LVALSQERKRKMKKKIVAIGVVFLLAQIGFLDIASAAYPTKYIITPKDGATNVNLQPKVRIWANDTDGGTITVEWYRSYDDKTYIPGQTNSSVPANSIVQWNYSQATSYNTKYYWKVQLTDNTNNSMFFGAYTFTTKVAPPSHIPTTYLITPKNQSINVNKKPKCRIWANDTAGGTLTVNFYSNSTGSWIKRQKNSSVVANSIVQWNYSQASYYSKKYWWKVTIYDGTTNISRLYYFTTKSGPHVPTTYLITPKNQSTNLNKKPNCKIWANDSNGETLIVNFYENSTGVPVPVWARRQKNIVEPNSRVQWNFSQASSYSKKYWWKVTIYDGTTNISRLYYFTTKAEPDTVVYVNPVSKTVLHTETFTLNISGIPKQPIKGYEFKVSFDPSLLQANAVTEGNIFAGYETFFNDGIINNTAGTIINIYGVILGLHNVTAPGSFVSISFTAKTTNGISAIGLSDVGVVNESVYVPISVGNGSVRVTTAGSP
jgi:hypothetical protein